MSEFEVNSEKLKRHAGSMKEISGELNAYILQISVVSRNLNGVMGNSYGSIAKSLGSIMTSLEKSRKTADSMESVLTGASMKYSETEKAIVRKATKVFVKYGASSSFGNAEASDSVEDGKSSLSASTSVWDGEAWIDVEEGLVSVEGSATVLGAETSASGGLEPWKASGKAEASLAVLSASGSMSALGGLASMKAEGAVLGAKVSASGQATLTGLNGSAKASASVAQGSIKEQFGTDQYNINAKLEGAVVGAEASVKGGFGVYEKDGKTVVGLQAEAGAEAYLAKGEVKAGFTFMGIEVKAKLEGKAGAIGGKVDADVTNNSIKLGGSLSALLGLGAEVEVDWSNFKLW